jgi:hypothetical protein
MNQHTKARSIEILTAHTQDPNHPAPHQDFIDYLEQLYPNEENLKGIVVGCAIFRKDQQMIKLLSKDKLEKLNAKYRIEVSNIYLGTAKEYLLCCKT